jgi:hypothetical protein
VLATFSYRQADGVQLAASKACRRLNGTNQLRKSLRSYRTIVQLIATTTTDPGLKLRAELDKWKSPKAVKVMDDKIRSSTSLGRAARLRITEGVIDRLIYGQPLSLSDGLTV